MARLLPAIIAVAIVSLVGRSLVFIAGSTEARMPGRLAPRRKLHQGITMMAKSADRESFGLFRWIGVFLETAVGGEELGKAQEKVANAPSSSEPLDDILWPIRQSLSFLFGNTAETVPSMQMAPERSVAENGAFAQAAPSRKTAPSRVAGLQAAIGKIVEKVPVTYILDLTSPPTPQKLKPEDLPLEAVEDVSKELRSLLLSM